MFTVVTGVSGSGKSSLMNQTLFPELHNRLNKGKMYPLENSGIEGLEHLGKGNRYRPVTNWKDA